MSSITISNLRFSPYTQKDEYKPIFGATMEFSFVLPTPHRTGDRYCLGLDYEKVVYPPSRPLCAYTEAYVIDGDVLSMSLKLTTARFRNWVCTLRKPTPITLQLVRIRGQRQETILLDDILALPSVVDGQNIVVEGDPLAELLDAKMDKPAVEGQPGQILSIDENGQNVWKDEQEIPEQVQADWDESDSSEVSFIQNKPTIPTKVSELQNDSGYQTGSDVSTALEPYSLTIDTGSKLSLSMDSDYKLTIGLLNASDTALDSKTVDLPIESMIINASYANGVLTLTLQNGQTISVDISDIVSGLVPDSRKVNGHALSADVTVTAGDLGLATVATSGSYNDLTDKPVIPEQVQADWDESDSSEVSFIQNKPTLPTQDELVPAATSSDEGKVLTVDSNGDAEWAEVQGGTEPDYFWLKASGGTRTLSIDKSSSNAPVIAVEYSFDKQNWTSYAWNGTTGESLNLTNNQRVYFRGDNETFASAGDCNKFNFHGERFNAGGNLLTLISKSGVVEVIPDYCFRQLFKNQMLDFRGNHAPIKVVADEVSSHSFEETFYDAFLLTDNDQNMVVPVKFTIGWNHKLAFERCFYGCRFYYLPDINGGNFLLSSSMFEGCTDLKFVKLPSFYSGAYQAPSNVFKGCTSLERVELSWIPNRVSGFFDGCTSLKKIKLHNNTGLSGIFPSITNWLRNVSANGVIEIPKGITVQSRSENTVPAGWSIIYYDEIDTQADWDESDSSEVSFIQNKPTLPTADQLLPVSTSSDEGKVLTVDSNGDAEWAEAQGGTEGNEDYFCATFPTVTLTKVGTPTAVELEYSFDKLNWYPVVVDQAISTNGKCYFRGNNNTFSYNTLNYYRFAFAGSSYASSISGNIMSLLDKSCTSKVVPDVAFYGLFRWSNVSSEQMIITNKLKLPATTIGQFCYAFMFHNQSNMHGDSICLPALEVPRSAYESMFQGCSSFNGMAILQAVKFGSNGNYYKNMFSGCLLLSKVICPNLKGSYFNSTNTSGWMDNAGNSASSREFYCLQAETIATRDGNTVPSNWTIYSLSASPAALVPSSTSTDEGKVLTVNASGTPEWATAQGGGGGAAPDGEDPLWVETENASGGFLVEYTSGWTGTVEYSYDKATWTSIVLDGTQTTLYTTVPFNGHHRVYLRKDAPNSSSQGVYISGTSITRIGGNLSSMNTSYSGTAPAYEFNSLFGHANNQNTALRDISELKIPMRALGANAMSYLFRGCTVLAETMPIPVAFSVPGSDTTTYLTGSWTDAFEGCSNLVTINLTLVDGTSNIDKTLGLYRITDNSLNGMIDVIDGTTYIRVNCTDIAPNGKFSATAVGLPLLQNVQARTSNTLNPGSPYVPRYTVGSGESRTLSLNSTVLASISGGANMVYGEVIIDCDANGTVDYNSTYFSADSDPVVPGKRNWCVYRVLGDKGKMYVVDTQDLPGA